MAKTIKATDQPEVEQQAAEGQTTLADALASIAHTQARMAELLEQNTLLHAKLDEIRTLPPVPGQPDPDLPTGSCEPVSYFCRFSRGHISIAFAKHKDFRGHWVDGKVEVIPVHNNLAVARTHEQIRGIQSTQAFLTGQIYRMDGVGRVAAKGVVAGVEYTAGIVTSEDVAAVPQVGGR